jgi:serine/threonine protein kinase
MELYGLRRVSSSDPDVHEVDPYSLEKVIHPGKSNIRILRSFSSKMNETVAVKLFPKQKNGKCMPNFFNEERSASLLSHPHILKYYSFYQNAIVQIGKDEFKEYSAIIMEYVPYGDLFGLVSQRPFSEKLARTVFKQILSALKYLHGQGLAHLDLKLENILIDPKDGVKLIDFDACEATDKTMIDPNKGSLGYRAPEFSKGTLEDLLPADIYSLGVVLFIMVVGIPPYTETDTNGKVHYDKYYEALQHDVKRFWKAHESHRENDGRPRLTKAFKNLVEAMLKEDPNQRPKICELERMEWIKGDTYTKAELENKIKGFFQH